tara:strand:+ start:163 stop:375 length:213 start_codon:yes stop_codon:yes gene_type:complete
MFKNFNKLIPCRSSVDNNIKEVTNNIKNNVNNIINNIPISERWECRDFNIKNNNIKSSLYYYSLIVPKEK